jgi:hypothetical protein
MEITIILKTLFSLGVVFCILYVLLKFIQKYTRIGHSTHSNIKGNGLKIENIVYIDDTMKLVNVTDTIGNNYIIGVGKNNSFLIDKYKHTAKQQKEHD